MTAKMTDEEIIQKLKQMVKEQDDGYCEHLAHGGKADKAHEEWIEFMNTVIAIIEGHKVRIDDLERNDIPRYKDALQRANKYGMFLEQENRQLEEKIELLQAGLDAAIAGQHTLQQYIATMNERE